MTLAQGYMPFGMLLWREGDAASAYGFTGEQEDVAVGLVFLRARYYDPTTGRFISKDPFPGNVWRPGTLNRFAYTTNNPVNLVDPLGYDGGILEGVLKCGSNGEISGGGIMGANSNQLVTCMPLLFLTSTKQAYRKDEKVTVTVTLANLTQSHLVINKRLQMIFDCKYREAYELRFHIIGPDKALVVPRRIMEDRLWPYPKPDDFTKLLPGDQWRQEIVLSPYFNFSESGTYQIVVEYHNDHNGHQFGLDAWTGELRSLPVEVFIGE